MGFNRYMVECKSVQSTNLVGCSLCFNRYMVECKLKKRVLVCYTVKVLIDTWWNVNSLDDLLKEDKKGFNRYMVECKYLKRLTKIKNAVVLIDTWWNVNKGTRATAGDDILF